METKPNKATKKSQNMSVTVAIGLMFGTALGVAMNNLAVWVAIVTGLVLTGMLLLITRGIHANR